MMSEEVYVEPTGDGEPGLWVGTVEGRTRVAVAENGDGMPRFDLVVHDPSLSDELPFRIIEGEAGTLPVAELWRGMTVVAIVIVAPGDGTLEADDVLPMGPGRPGPGPSAATAEELEVVAVLLSRLNDGDLLEALDLAGLSVTVDVGRLSTPIGRLVRVAGPYGSAFSWVDRWPAIEEEGR